MVDTSKFVNHFELADDLQKFLTDPANWNAFPCRQSKTTSIYDGHLYTLSDLMPMGIAALLRMVLQAHQWQAVGLDGFANKPVEEIGNYRLSNYNEALASVLWSRIQPWMPNFRSMDRWTPTDHYNHREWRPVGVSPLFRYIRYAEGGQLVGHYDATFEENENRRSLMSLVIYLTHNENGATRFLKDKYFGVPMDERDFSDWNRAGKEDEVIFRSAPEIGKAIIFDHRLLHDSEPLLAGDPEKIIIRTDIMFEKV